MKLEHIGYNVAEPQKLMDWWCANLGFKQVHPAFIVDSTGQMAIEFYNNRKAEGKFPGNHVIILCPMYDFRWHKWGQYIGKFNPSHEYFSDEEGIEMVYSFQIHRVG